MEEIVEPSAGGYGSQARRSSALTFDYGENKSKVEKIVMMQVTGAMVASVETTR